jgi:thioredoxin 1
MNPALLRFLVLAFAGLSPLASADTAASVRAALASGQPALIEFGADTCSQCKRMKGVLDGIAQRYRGRAQVIQVNVNREKALTRQFRIMVIPTLVYFDRQGREAGRAYGYQDEVTVAKKLHDLGAR